MTIINVVILSVQGSTKDGPCTEKVNIVKKILVGYSAPPGLNAYFIFINKIFDYKKCYFFHLYVFDKKMDALYHMTLCSKPATF